MRGEVIYNDNWLEDNNELDDVLSSPDILKYHIEKMEKHKEYSYYVVDENRFGYVVRKAFEPPLRGAFTIDEDCYDKDSYYFVDKSYNCLTTEEHLEYGRFDRSRFSEMKATKTGVIVQETSVYDRAYYKFLKAVEQKNGKIDLYIKVSGYDKITEIGDYLIVKASNYYGLVDDEGREILSCNNRQIIELPFGIIFQNCKNKWYLLSDDKKVIVPINVIENSLWIEIKGNNVFALYDKSKKDWTYIANGKDDTVLEKANTLKENYDKQIEELTKEYENQLWKLGSKYNNQERPKIKLKNKK